MYQKIRALILLVIMVLVSGAFQGRSVQAAEKKPKERLAVLDLEAKHGVEKSLAEALSGIVRDKIHSFGEFQVMSKEDIHSVATREQLKQAMGCDDSSSECLVEFGRMIGTRFMVAGDISKIGTTYTVSLRMMDTQGESAGVTNRIRESCKCNDDALIGTVEDVASKLLGKPSTTVAKKADDEETKRLAEQKKKTTEAEQKRIVEERRKADEEKQKLATENERLKKEKAAVDSERDQLAEEKKKRAEAVKLLLLEQKKAEEVERQRKADEEKVQAIAEAEQKRIAELLRKEDEAAQKRIANDNKILKPDPAKDALSEKASLKKDRILLRKDNIGIIGDARLKSIINSKNFYEKDLNPSGSFENYFEALNDEVLIDKKTNLLWQIKGSQKKLTMYAAKQYIKELNSSNYAENSDWRLPSIEELASLMKKNVNDSYYIDSRFSKKQSKCWSNDEAPSMNSAPGDTGRWLADFEKGLISKASWFDTVRTASSSHWTALYELNPENYVRAVCTLKER